MKDQWVLKLFMNFRMFECEECGNQIHLSLIATEYPTEAFNYSSEEVRGGELISDPYWEIEIDDYDMFLYQMESYKENILNMEPREFEHFIARIFKNLECEEVIVTNQTRDGGFDVVAKKGGFIPCRILAECKHYAMHRPVGIDIIRSAFGVLEDSQANMIFVITSSRFTSGAIDFAKKHGDRIILWDVEALTKVLYNLDIEVHERS